MPYVRVPDPLLDVNKPGRSTDWKQIRDNQDYFDASITTLNRLAITTAQDIREHFTGVSINTTTGGLWTQALVSGGTITLTRTTTHTAIFAWNAGDTAVLSGSDYRQRIMKSEEYVAFCECRVKRTGTDQDLFRFGWNDNGLSGATLVTDGSDGVYVEAVTGGTNDWLIVTANGGSTTTHTINTTNTTYHIIRLEFTCSATAGSRKVEIYFDNVLQATLNTDANMPTALLKPFIGGSSASGGARSFECDYILFGFLTTPIAA